jgi:hypothetical protein
MSRSASGKHVGQSSRYLNGGTNALMRGPFKPGDDQVGTWTPAQLIRMDADFVTAMERAFARGRELRSSASKQRRPVVGDLDRLAS